MKITVTDANIFIDLIRLQWLGYLFSIEIAIYTTLEVVEELKENQRELLNAFVQSKQLTVYCFNADELVQITAMNAPRALTTIDKSLVFLAKQIGGGVLSGDNPLRKFCETSELEVRGIIWLFDRFIELGLITHEAAIEKMNHLLLFNNRLPAADCEQRLREWGRE